MHNGWILNEILLKCLHKDIDGDKSTIGSSAVWQRAIVRLNLDQYPECYMVTMDKTVTLIDSF